MKRSELKAAAKQSIKGNIGLLFIIALLTTLITGTIIGSLLIPGLTLSLCAIYLMMAKGEKPRVSDMFCRMSGWGKSFWLSIITAFFLSLWSCLGGIPGIVKSYAYSMAPFVLADNPNMTARVLGNCGKDCRTYSPSRLCGKSTLYGISRGICGIFIHCSGSSLH